MSTIVALLLGLVQGLTEFLPISSTAHLTLAGSLLGVVDSAHPERWTAFMATIQLGTLAAVIWYFRTDIIRTVTGWLRQNIGSARVGFRQQTADARLGWLVIIGTIPIVVVGLALKPVIEGALTKDLSIIAFSLIGVGLLLLLAERVATFTRSTSDMRVIDAIVIGGAQCLALIPGSSRSGTTMMAAMFRGMTREHAARFSFLLSIPAVFAAGVLEFAHEAKHITWSDGGVQLAVATLAAFASGYWSIAFLLNFLKTRTLLVFVVYRVALGLILLFTGCSNPQSDSAKPVEQIRAPETALQVPPEPQSVRAVATDTVSVVTSMGRFSIELYGKDAPLTVNNFLSLVARKYYNGILVHRVAKDYVVQLGDPTTRDSRARASWGSGGETADGKPLAEELNASLPSAAEGYRKGIVAMARKRDSSGSGTSQFFICLDEAINLPYSYTIFGNVIEGWEVIKRISAVEVEPGPLGDADGTPRKPIRVTSIKRISR